MRITILLILLNLNDATAKDTTETYICSGREESYNCVKYNGKDPNVYSYTSTRSDNSPSVYEFDDSGTRNPYAPADSEGSRDGSADSIAKSDTPIFIPYNPFYLYQSLGSKK